MRFRRAALALALPGRRARARRRSRSARARARPQKAGGVGKADEDEERVRPRHRQEGDRQADQDRRDRHQAAGHQLDDIPNMAKAYFECVNDNGGIRGRPDRLHRPHRADQPRAGGRVREEARRGRRSSRWSGTRRHRLRGQPRVLRAEGVLHDRLTASTRVLRRDAEQLRRQHGPALQHARGGAVPDPQGRQGRSSFDRSNAAGTGYNKPADRIPQGRRVPSVDVRGPVPFQAAKRALKYVQPAGRSGGVMLELHARRRRSRSSRPRSSRESRTTWRGAARRRATPTSRQGRRHVLERQVRRQRRAQPDLGAGGRTATLYRAVRDKYHRSGGLGTFGQFGFLDARVAVGALLT